MTAHEDAVAARRAAWAKMNKAERKAEWARFREANPVKPDEIRRAFDPPKRVHSELYRRAALMHRDSERARLEYLKEVASLRIRAFDVAFNASHPGIDPVDLETRRVMDPMWHVLHEDYSQALDRVTAQSN